MYLVYSLLYYAVTTILLPFELNKRDSSIRKEWLSQKLGHFSPGNGNGPVFWLHAVSVGEVIASVPFLRELRERIPGVEIIVSTITDTGQAVAKERLGQIARIIYLPFDMQFTLNRAIRSLRPDIFCVMETEIWPNLFRCMKSNQVPVAMLNGRISGKSFKGYLKIRGILKKILQNVELFCMQDEVYAQRIVELGADHDKVINTGTFKFDIKVKDKDLSWLSALGSPVVVVGSTHRGEDALMVRAFKGLKVEFPGLSMVIAPRHPERFDEVEALIKEEGVPCVRRSTLESEGNASGSVVLLDTVGELSSVYRAADVAVMGGSFVKHGGQNPLEAAFWSKPVICGPHMWNFPFMDEFHEQNAAVQTDQDGLESTLRSLLKDTGRAQDIGDRAKAIVEKNRGAVSRALSAVEALFERK